MNDNDRPDPRTVASWRRALDVLPAEHRAMVLRLSRALLLAADLPSAAAQRSRIRAVAADTPDGDGDDASDDLARAAARRILARHGRGDGAA